MPEQPRPGPYPDWVCVCVQTNRCRLHSHENRSGTLQSVHQSFKIDTDATSEQLFGVLSDLSLYPQWLDLVDEAHYSDDVEGSERPAWNVTLRAKLGPFARSKKLRMERTITEPTSHVRFERSEVDDREHSAWTMDALITENANAGASVEIQLTYGGELWSKALEAVLMAHVNDAGPKLRAMVEGPDQGS